MIHLPTTHQDRIIKAMNELDYVALLLREDGLDRKIAAVRITKAVNRIAKALESAQIPKRAKA